MAVPGGESRLAVDAHLPREAKLQVSFNGGNRMKFLSIVPCFTGRGPALSNKENLFLRHAVRPHSADVPVRRIDGDVARL